MNTPKLLGLADVAVIPGTIYNVIVGSVPVPSSRFLAAFALLVLPAAAAARVPGIAAECYAWIGLVLCIFVLDG